MNQAKLCIILFFFHTLLFSQNEIAEVDVVDTLSMTLPLNISNDTSYARNLLIELRDYEKKRNYLLAYNKADTAFHIYNNALGFETKEVVDCLNKMAANAGFLQQKDRALSLFYTVLRIRKNMFDEPHVEIASAYNNLGLFYSRIREDSNAIKCHYQSLEMRLALFGEEHSEVANSYTSLGLCYNAIGVLDTAILLTQKGLDIRIRIFKDNHPSIADSYNNLGGFYMINGEFDVAADLHKKALDIRLILFGEGHPNLVNSYNNLAFCYSKIGYYDIAFNYMNASLGILLATVGENDPYTASTYNNLGEVYNSKNDFYHAEEYYMKALQIRLGLFGEEHPAVARSYHNIGSCYSSIAKYELAIYYLQKALSIKILTLGETHPDLPPTYNGLGDVYFNMGDNGKAIEYFQIAFDVQANIYGADHPSLSDFLVNIARVYERSEPDKAIAILNKAIEIQFNSEWTNYPNLNTIYLKLGNVYSMKGEYNEAILNYQKALSICDRMYFGKGHPGVIDINNNLAIVYQAKDQLDSAHFYITKAIEGIQVQRTSDIIGDTKSLYQSQNLILFEKAVDIILPDTKGTISRKVMEDIFSYAEMSKSTLLQYQINQNNALSFAGIPDSLILAEKDLRITINYREKQRQSLMESGLIETDTIVLRISAIIFDLKRQQEMLMAFFEKEYPDYYRLRYDLSTISLDEVQGNLLRPDQSLIEFFVGDSTIYLITITRDTYDVKAIKSDFQLDSMVNILQSGLYAYYGAGKGNQSDALYKSSLSDYTMAATVLYDKLISPIKHLLTRDVIIVPDGVLGYVPFEALLSGQPEVVGRFETYPFFIRDHQVSYTYSASLLKEMKEKIHSRKPEKSLIAFAPFYTGSYALLDSTVNIVLDTLNNETDTTYFQAVVTRKDFSSLPSSGEEVTTAAKLWKGDYYINSDATEQRFYDMAGNYRIVHLATHGLTNEKQGDYSYLAFGEVKDTIENEFLFVRDIYNSSLNADLVVLSACETARGELQRGEGIISLARAFAYAGARSILTTLWVVDDTGTKDLIKEFYVNMRKGQVTDAALRNSKVNQLTKAKSQYRHPFFWSGFIAVGDMDSMSQ